MTRVGLRYALFAAAVIVVNFLASTGLYAAVPEWVENNLSLVNFLLIIFGIYMVGFPLIYLLNRNLPSIKLEKSSLGAGNFFLGLLFCEGIAGVGMLMGNICEMGVSALLGRDFSNDAVTMLMMDSEPFIRILTAGILAPIFEELIFRKILIDHLLEYGKWLSVAASGIMFGLFHGNFSQCFYAAGLGFFWAYIYIKTGRIRYSIAYHMIFNLTSAVVSVPLSLKYLSAVESVGMEELASGSVMALLQVIPSLLLLLGWTLALLLIMLIGFILLCVNLKKFRLEEEEGALGFGKSVQAVFTNPGMLAFMGVCLFMFVQTYLFV